MFFVDSEQGERIIKGTMTFIPRVLNPKPHVFEHGKPMVYDRKKPGRGITNEIKCPYKVGDKVQIREPFMPLKLMGGFCPIHEATYVCFRDGGQVYKINGQYVPQPESCSYPDQTKWPKGSRFYPPNFMPAWAVRSYVEVTAIKLDKLQNIDEEGIRLSGTYITPLHVGIDSAGEPIESEYSDKDPWWHFEQEWNSIHGNKYPYDSNPYVWMTTFKRVGK